MAEEVMKLKKLKHFKNKMLSIVWICSIVVAIEIGIASGIYVFTNKFFNPKSLSLDNYVKPIEFRIDASYRLDIRNGLEVKKLDGITVYGYNAVPEQTDDTPNIARSGRIVYEGSCAVSQDLWGKDIKPGDIIYVESLSRCLVVEDTLNVRHTKAIDVFFHEKKDALKVCGKKSSIYIMRTQK